MKHLTLFIISICFIAFFVACSNEKIPNELNASTLIPQNTTFISPIESPVISHSEDEKEVILHFYDNTGRDEIDTNSLQNHIAEQLGIKIKIHMIDNNFYTRDINLVDSIISLDNYTYSNYIEEKRKFFIPLEDILANSEVFSVLPDEFKECLEDDFGHIWCIPRFFDINLDTRVYSKKILDEINEKVPTNLDEFTNILLRVKSHFNDDIVILKTTANSCLIDFYDIFRTYGLNLQGGSTIGYNTATRKYEDFSQSADIDGLLTYFKFLIENGLLIIEDQHENGASKAQMLFNGSLLSYKTALSYMGSPSEYYTISLDKNTKTQVELFDSSMIFVGIGTENPNEILNLYLETFYGSNKANIIGTYGESGYRADYTDYEKVEVKTLDHEAIVTAALRGDFPYTASLCGTGYYNDYLRYMEGITTEEIETRQITYKEYMELRDNGFKNNQFEIVPPLKKISDIERIKHSEVFSIFRVLFFEFLTQDLSSEQFFMEYKLRTERAGLEDFLRELNSN